MKNKQNQTIEVEITDFSKKGNGIGFFKKENGMISKVEVPFTMPGDFVKALIIRKKGGIFFAKLEELIKASPKREKPRCIHFGSCGGCKLQHFSYEDQAEYKQQLVLEYFQPLLNQDVRIYPILKAPSPWQYRNKMEFSFSSDAQDNKYLGLIINSSRGKVLNLNECHLTNPWFIDALKAVTKWWHASDLKAYHMTKNSGSLRTLTVREGQTTKDRMVMLTVSGNPEFALHKHHLNDFVDVLKAAVTPDSNETSLRDGAEPTLSIFLRIQQIAKGVETNFYEMHLFGKDHISEILNIKLNEVTTPFKFTISPTAFFQPNSAQAANLYGKALEIAKLTKDDIVYDLYCGTGTLGICIAKHVKQVIGIEISPESSLDARTNAKNNDLNNYTIYTGCVSKVLKEKELPQPDLVMIDPPRSGLEVAALNQIVNLNAKKIVYISCNPETQSKNVEELIKAGYRLVALQPVDQFPQTVHIENIALLVRDN